MKVWIVVGDYGYDGLGEPLGVFKTERAAVDYMDSHPKSEWYTLEIMEYEVQ